jgi:hypothetical protein
MMESSEHATWGSIGALQGTAVFVIVVATLFQYSMCPFWDGLIDVLDCICCSSVLLHTLAVLLYANPRFTRKDYYYDVPLDDADSVAPNARLLEQGLIVVNALTLLSIFSMFWLAMIKDGFRRSSLHVLAARVSQDVAQLQRQLVLVKSSCEKELDATRQMVPQLDSGERVFHQRHGGGTITDVTRHSTQEHEISVRFDSGYVHHYKREKAARKLSMLHQADLSLLSLRQFTHVVRSALADSALAALSEQLLGATFLILSRIGGDDGNGAGVRRVPIRLVTLPPIRRSSPTFLYVV